MSNPCMVHHTVLLKTKIRSDQTTLSFALPKPTGVHYYVHEPHGHSTIAHCTFRAIKTKQADVHRKDPSLLR
jgi:hypothetical protein